MKSVLCGFGEMPLLGGEPACLEETLCVFLNDYVSPPHPAVRAKNGPFGPLPHENLEGPRKSRLCPPGAWLTLSSTLSPRQRWSAGPRVCLWLFLALASVPRRQVSAVTHQICGFS